MIEYLIRPVDAEWFDLPKGSDPYRTLSIPYATRPGRSHAAIVVEGCEISFSYEDPGIQVSFEGSMSQERSMIVMEELRLSVENVSGQRARVVKTHGESGVGLRTTFGRRCRLRLDFEADWRMEYLARRLRSIFSVGCDGDHAADEEVTKPEVD